MEKKYEIAFTEEQWRVITRALSHFQIAREDAYERAKGMSPAAMSAAKNEIFAIACMMDDIINTIKEDA